MYYVYVLKSEKDSMFYVGYTSDLKRRFAEHSEGLVKSTKHRRPLEIVYYEASRDHRDAMKRERYLKTAYGKRYIKNRLKNDLVG